MTKCEDKKCEFHGFKHSHYNGDWVRFHEKIDA